MESRENELLMDVFFAKSRENNDWNQEIIIGQYYIILLKYINGLDYLRI